MLSLESKLLSRVSESREPRLDASGPGHITVKTGVLAGW